jgi:predicted Zn-dependent protease
LVGDANVLERSRDWQGALEKLDEAKAIQPKQPFLWSNYGYVAMFQNKPDEAKQHYRHEIALHPDEGFVVRLYGGFLHGRGEDTEALAVLNAFYNNDPTDEGVDMLLAMIEAPKSLPNAITTLRKASEALPSNHMIQSALGEDLVANHQDADAAAIAKKLLADAPDDADNLNSAAYLLAEADGDLPLAEESSRKSLQMLDAATAQSELSEANEQTFRRANILVACWDTLGFILMKEKKLNEAHDYLEAAWRSQPNMVVGMHYAQVLEAQGNAKEALRVYHQAPRPRTPAPEEKLIDDSIARLKNAGVQYTGAAAGEFALQEDRTFKMQLKPAAKSLASSTYRLEVNSGGIKAVMLVGGQPHDNAEDAIKHITLPHLVPTGSHAKVVRDAVLTCSPGSTECYFVIMPMGGMIAEQAGR